MEVPESIQHACNVIDALNKVYQENIMQLKEQHKKEMEELKQFIETKERVLENVDRRKLKMEQINVRGLYPYVKLK